MEGQFINCLWRYSIAVLGTINLITHSVNHIAVLLSTAPAVDTRLWTHSSYTYPSPTPSSSFCSCFPLLARGIVWTTWVTQRCGTLTRRSSGPAHAPAGSVGQRTWHDQEVWYHGVPSVFPNLRQGHWLRQVPLRSSRSPLAKGIQGQMVRRIRMAPADVRMSQLVRLKHLRAWDRVCVRGFALIRRCHTQILFCEP